MVRSAILRLFSLGLLVSALILTNAKESHAFGGPSFPSQIVPTPNGGQIFFSNLQGTETAFMSLGGSGEVPGGSFYFNFGTIPASAITPGGLATLGYLNATIISQNGADSTYASDGYLGVVFTAQETVGGPLYRYEIALSGVTTTQIINTRTLVDATQPTATI